MIWLFFAGLSGAIGVALGAAGAHLPPAGEGGAALAGTATAYQMWHALALGLVALLSQQRRGLLLTLAGALFVVGTLLFSGGLYLRAFRGLDLGLLVPLGGSAFILGWLSLALAAVTLGRRKP